VQKKVFDGSIDYIQVMDENGNVDAALFPSDIDDAKIIGMYEWMSFARAVDAKALSLQRQGRAVTYAPILGQEGEQVGSALALGSSDYFVPNFRQHGVFLVKGASLDKMFLGWRGYEDGGVVPQGFNGLAVIVPVATQLPHAAGLAYALKQRKTGGAVLGYVGDGGTSEGDFYESINFAGVKKVPLVVAIENNEWAISMPRSKQSAAETLAQKAIAAGIKGVQVDGNDVIGVYKVIKDALQEARNGNPVLVEMLTYRMSMHTTADDPTKYRSDDELDVWKKRDPILRIRLYLNAKGLWDDAKEQQMADEQKKKIDEAVAVAEAFKEDPSTMFKNVYSFMPKTLQEELDGAEASNFWLGGTASAE
jgi:pyruvate dehydrogenase E1 component alpha subunit